MTFPINPDLFTDDEISDLAIGFTSSYICALDSKGLVSLAQHLMELAVKEARQEERDGIADDIIATPAVNRHRYTKREALTAVVMRDLRDGAPEMTSDEFNAEQYRVEGLA